ncbi:MAG: hypothetical protein ACXVC2_02305 [Bacteroidia bacterium]
MNRFKKIKAFAFIFIFIALKTNVLGQNLLRNSSFEEIFSSKIPENSRYLPVTNWLSLTPNSTNGYFFFSSPYYGDSSIKLGVHDFFHKDDILSACRGSLALLFYQEYRPGIEQELSTPLKKGKYLVKIRLKQGGLASNDSSFIQTQIRFGKRSLINKKDNVLKLGKKENIYSIPISKYASFENPFTTFNIIVSLKGGERYISIGAFKRSKFKNTELIGGSATLIDDVQLIPLKRDTFVNVEEREKLSIQSSYNYDSFYMDYKYKFNQCTCWLLYTNNIIRDSCKKVLNHFIYLLKNQPSIKLEIYMPMANNMIEQSILDYLMYYLDDDTRRVRFLIDNKPLSEDGCLFLQNPRPLRTAGKIYLPLTFMLTDGF